MRFFYLLMSIAIVASAIEIKVKPSKDVNSTTKLEARLITSKIYKEKNIKLTKEAAQKYIQENRLLSNAYLREYKQLPKEYQIAIKLEIEEKLADEYVKRFQNKMKLDKDTLESYYIVHKKEFVKPKTYVFYPIEFSNYEEANKFYQKYKEHIGDLKQYIKKSKIKRLVLSEDRINFMVRNLFREQQPETLVPPIFLGKKFVIFYIDDIQLGKQMSFEEAKRAVKKKLFEKAFTTTRKKLLDKLTKK